MKYRRSSKMNQHESDVETLLMSSCWTQNQNGQDQYMLEGHKLLLDNDLDELTSDSEVQKGSMDVLDSLILNSHGINTNLAELKPLPPFTTYASHVSINGIAGHHYHSISQRMTEDNNNYSQSPYHNQNTDQNIVSSSTCLPDSVLNPDTSDSCLDVKLFGDNGIDSKMYSIADSCVLNQGPDSVSGIRIYAEGRDLGDYGDMNSIEDIAAIIGSAIADTTVPNQTSDGHDSRDSWVDLDAWIGNYAQQDSKIVLHQESINEFILPNSPIHTSNQTQQCMLTTTNMPLLHSRLQNGPPIKLETPSSTSYCGEMITTSTSPGSVVSTTDNMINGRYLSNHNHYQLSINAMKSDGLCSPDLLINYPHTTTTTPNTQKQKRRSQKKQAQNHMNMCAAAQVNYQPNDLLGKEKTVHRCNICNRGFLNKSNIKVHLRTHTGEKPFRCEVCSKAFRQKAHLIKHQQIHKRIGRD